MSKEPEKKMKKSVWVGFLIAVIGIIVVRLGLHVAGIELSDTVSRIFGGAEIVAMAGMVYCYMRWRKQQQ